MVGREERYNDFQKLGLEQFKQPAEIFLFIVEPGLERRRHVQCTSDESYCWVVVMSHCDESYADVTCNAPMPPQHTCRI